MFWTATTIFVVAYAAIVSEKINKTKVALFGAAITLVLKILDQREAFHDIDLGVDWNVVFLLISMMIIVNILTRTGIFQYLAVRAAKLAKGEPFRIMVILALVTAVCSAFLDNVTTVLLIAPVTLVVAGELKIDPVPVLITEVLASNIGGTATLIGDPPNIMIASRAGLNFMDFIANLAPVVVIILAVWLLIWKFIFGRRYQVADELKALIMAMNPNELITDPKLLWKAGAVLSLTIVGFIVHGALGFEPATVALTGAALLLVLSGLDVHKILSEIEWPSIFFFIGLFIIIGGTIKAGLISWLSQEMISLTHPTPDDTFSLSMVMIWFSALASGIIDNIPFVATMNPLLVETAHTLFSSPDGTNALQHAAMLPIWWSLALGACLGGNGTSIGASANVIVVGIAGSAGHHISFKKFLAYGLPVTFLSGVISTLYVWIRYYVLGL